MAHAVDRKTELTHQVDHMKLILQHKAASSFLQFGKNSETVVRRQRRRNNCIA